MAHEPSDIAGHINVNRRTALKLTGGGILGAVGFSSNAVAQPPPNLPTWGSDGTDHWQLMDTNNPTPSDHTSHRPLYEIEPAGGAHSPHSPGHEGFDFPHDLVVDTPGAGKSFTANWHVIIIVEDAEEGITKENVTNGGISNPTVSKIQDALSDGDVEKIGPGVDFTCPVRPHNPTDED